MLSKMSPFLSLPLYLLMSPPVTPLRSPHMPFGYQAAPILWPAELLTQLGPIVELAGIGCDGRGVFMAFSQPSHSCSLLLPRPCQLCPLHLPRRDFGQFPLLCTHTHMLIHTYAPTFYWQSNSCSHRSLAYPWALRSPKMHCLGLAGHTVSETGQDAMDVTGLLVLLGALPADDQLLSAGIPKSATAIPKSFSARCLSSPSALTL